MAYGFSRDFAKSLLGLVVQDQAFGYRVVTTVDPEQISQKVVSTVLSTLQGYAISNGGIPNRTVSKELIRKRNYNGDVSDKLMRKCVKAIDGAYKIHPIARADATSILKDAIMDVEVVQALEEGYALYKDRKYDDFFKRMEAARTLASRLDMGSRGVNLAQDLEAYLDKISRGDARVIRYPIGIDALDRSIKGGLGRGELGCILGGEKAGKSMALVHIAATSVLLGLKVCYLSFELGELEVQNRISSNMTALLLDELEEGGPAVSARLGKKLRAILRMGGGNLIVKQFPAKSATVRDVESYLRDVVVRDWGTRPDVLIIDYADEMKSSATRTAATDNTYLQMGEIYSGLRALGAPAEGSYSDHGGFDCVVWTASQVQRAALGKELLEFRDVADSIRKAAIVDLMVAICQTEEEIEIQQHRLFVALCRYAPGFKEVGPYTQDFEHGRLVKFDSTVRRFREGQWQKNSPRTVTGQCAVGSRMISSTPSRCPLTTPSVEASRFVPRFGSHRRAGSFVPLLGV